MRNRSADITVARFLLSCIRAFKEDGERFGKGSVARLCAIAVPVIRSKDHRHLDSFQTTRDDAQEGEEGRRRNACRGPIWGLLSGLFLMNERDDETRL